MSTPIKSDRDPMQPMLLPPSPYVRAKGSPETSRCTPTVRSFENTDFLLSHDARLIRILCEFQEPAQRLTKAGISGTILFFGSARAMKRSTFDETLAEWQQKLRESISEELRLDAERHLARLRKIEWMCEYVEKAETLARMLSAWSINSDDVKKKFCAGHDYLTGMPREIAMDHQPLVVTTGGGPGMMEAANKGASSVLGAKTMGMGITLPFERGLNPFVSSGMAFEFHYFFTRKFWMMYSVKALIMCPGGFGTLDELFELMTLVQTGKIPRVPIVLFGKKYWGTVVNWEALAEFGTVSQEEIDKLFMTDDVNEAFERVTSEILNVPCQGSPPKK